MTGRLPGFHSPGDADLQNILGAFFSKLDLSPPVQPLVTNKSDKQPKKGGAGGGGGKAKSGASSAAKTNKSAADAAAQAKIDKEFEPPETPLETVADPAPPKKAKVVLSNPQWVAAKPGFNEETPISVDVLLPEEHAIKTKITFELFAKTPKGSESICSGEAHTKDGKATCSIPVYIPAYKDEGGNRMQKVEYYFIAKHSEAEPLDGSETPKVVDEMAERVLERHILQNVTFVTGKSFVRTSEAADLKALGQAVKDWKGKHSDGKLAVFGHADAVGEELSNKALSERRAKSIHAYLAKDPKPWEALYGEEKWGLASVQELLKHLGHDPGTIDGQDGPKTQAAVKEFQGKKGLGQTGNADATTREALFLAYFESAGSPASGVKDFDAIDGKAFTGCSEFNLIENAQGASEANRRVAVLLLKVSKNFPINYPCKQGSILPCQNQTKLQGERRTAGFKCRFYDGLVVEKKGPVPKPVGDILELTWEKASIFAWDKSDAPEMKTKLKVKVEADQPIDGVELEIYQFSAEGNHEAYKRLKGLSISNGMVHGPDGKELEVKIEWHETIYDYGKNQYFCKLIVGEHEKDSGLDRVSLLQLKHYNGIIANPSGDLPGAGQEGVWVATHMRKHGPWMEATKGELIADGHQARLLNAVGNTSMKSLVEANKFIHHQSSHGTAYCWCDGDRNFVVDSGVAGSDGSNDWVCPVCLKSSNAVGVIMNKDFSNLFFRSDVKKLERSPKVLVLANCCLTAITGQYAKAWLNKGTRWYIGWAIPVGDAEAVNFAKAFYRRWFGHYKLEPDSVRKAYNDVKAPYAEFRPRIFGN